MTCIVGLVENGKVYMGADSAGVSGLDICIRADEKVFINNNFLMGFTTSFRMGQLLRYAFVPPKRFPGDDIDRFMVTKFIDGVRKCLKDGGFATKEKEAEEGGIFLVGYEGNLFYVGSDYQIGRNVYGYDAVGCGEKYALGSLYASKGNPRERIRGALMAAQQFSGGVLEPFHIIEI